MKQLISDYILPQLEEIIRKMCSPFSRYECSLKEAACILNLPIKNNQDFDHIHGDLFNHIVYTMAKYSPYYDSTRTIVFGARELFTPFLNNFAHDVYIKHAHIYIVLSKSMVGRIKNATRNLLSTIGLKESKLLNLITDNTTYVLYQRQEELYNNIDKVLSNVLDNIKNLLENSLLISINQFQYCILDVFNYIDMDVQNKQAHIDGLTKLYKNNLHIGYDIDKLFQSINK